jgi:hypothetical protein
MEIAKHIIEEAKSLLVQGVALPAQIKGAPEFFLATHEDGSVHAFGSVEHNGIFYKIGAKKPTKVQ